MALDLILLHPPSVYDFRQKTILYGPVSDLIPSTPVFEMYPIGFTTIAEYLERAGYHVRIINLAVRMLNDRKFNAEALINRLRSPVFGIDLHWLVHAHGAIEVARLVKRCHPEAKVVVGGFSASYYYKELLQYPEIDYVLRGDSTEEPFRQLMDCIMNRRQPEAVPNLVWRDSQGKIQENPFSYVPADLSNVMVNYYHNIIRSVIRHRDLTSYIPVKNWAHYPITGVLTCRGCNQNCVVCGGSAAAFRHFYNRQKTAFRSPKSVAQDIKQIEHFSNGPIFILGDLRQSGDDYAYELLRFFQRDGVKNQFILELFSPAPRDLLHQMSLSCPNFCLEISPESHDPEVRRAAGKHYSNQALEQTLSDALDVGCGRLDVFFMIGLPRQTPQSVMDTIDYCDFLLQKFRGDKRLALFIAPLSPFLDPGSLGFEQPQRYGYHILFRTLNEHRQALLSPSWKYSLNYETEWMTRQQIVDTAYEAILRLNRLKAKYGLISKKMADAGEQRVEAALAMMHWIDDLLSRGNYHEELSGLKAEVDRINMFPISEKTQLELPLGRIKLKFWRSLWSWATKRY
ncbi:MAG: TIGR04190 family B12-binding domain/radical SAM domain protein [Dehalococcoidales bacterium]|nr:TIGR04190 family B12-binding domain/radical SAM domain protein [Dehalococcoidales bacterium]